MATRSEASIASVNGCTCRSRSRLSRCGRRASVGRQGAGRRCHRASGRGAGPRRRRPGPASPRHRPVPSSQPSIRQTAAAPEAGGDRGGTAGGIARPSPHHPLDRLSHCAAVKPSAVAGRRTARRPRAHRRRDMAFDATGTGAAERTVAVVQEHRLHGCHSPICHPGCAATGTGEPPHTSTRNAGPSTDVG